MRSSDAPMVLSANATELAAWKAGAGHILRFSWMGADDVESLTVQQPFQAFLTTTFRFVPPQGWTFVADGPAAPPS